MWVKKLLEQRKSGYERWGKKCSVKKLGPEQCCVQLWIKKIDSLKTFCTRLKKLLAHKNKHHSAKTQYFCIQFFANALFLGRATVGTLLYVSLCQSVSQLVSVFQNAYQCTSRSCSSKLSQHQLQFQHPPTRPTSHPPEGKVKIKCQQNTALTPAQFGLEPLQLGLQLS